MSDKPWPESFADRSRVSGVRCGPSEDCLEVLEKLGTADKRINDLSDQVEGLREILASQKLPSMLSYSVYSSSSFIWIFSKQSVHTLPVCGKCYIFR